MIPPVHVLVVEDEPTIAVTLVDDLAEAGYRVAHEADGADAIRALAAHAFTAVVTDLRLPGADGLAVLQAARRLQPACRVMVVSAFFAAGGEEALAAGAAAVLTKPFHNGAVLRWLEHDVHAGRDMASRTA